MQALRSEQGPVREPHRHDYQELVWLRAGHGEQLLAATPIAGGTRVRARAVRATP